MTPEEAGALYDSQAASVAATPRLSPEEAGALYDTQITNQLSSQANFGQRAASGFLSQLGGIGDLASLIGKYNPMSSTFGIDVPKSENISSLLQSGSNLLADKLGTEHIPDVSGIAPDSYAYKTGQYLLGALAGGGGLVKTIGTDLLTSGGGYIGNKYGGPIGELGGAILAGSIPSATSKASSLITGAFTKAPSEDAALLKAFGVSDNNVSDALPVLQNLKEQGIIAPSDSATPYKDIASVLKSKMATSEANIQDVLDNAGGVTIADILPSNDNFPGIKSGAEQKAISQAVKTEQEGLIATGLQKLPEEDQLLLHPKGSDASPTELLQGYRKLQRQALSDPSSDEAGLFNIVNQKVSSTPLTASDLRDLRISYDQNAKFEAANASPKADAYKSFRNDLQQKILTLGGGPDSDLARQFENYANQIQGSRIVDPLLGAETKGNFTSEPIGKQVTQGVASLVSKKLAGESNPAYALKQLFGDTLGQRLVSEQTLPQKILSGISSPTGALASGLLGLASNGKALSPSGDIVGGIAGQLRADNVPSISAVKPQNDSLATALSNLGATKTMALKDVSNSLPKVPDSLLKAVIKQESSGNPDAVSSKGAQGLMQIMPATAKDIAKDLGITDYDLKDPTTNKKFGEYYLSKLLDQFNGNEELALAGYNAGPNRVQKLLDKLDTDNFDDIAEYLPKETQDYVERITANYNKNSKLA